MRFRFAVTLVISAMLGCIAGTASGQLKCDDVSRPNATIQERAGPSYYAVMAKYGVQQGGVGLLSHASRPDVQFGAAYEYLVHGQERAKEVERDAARIISQVDETMRAAQRFGVSGAQPGTPDVFGPALTNAEFEQIMAKIHSRRLAIKAELERREQNVLALLVAACAAEKQNAPPAAALIAISGAWTAMGTTYNITQSISGQTFTWTNAGLGGEKATGTIEGNTVKASWKGGRFGDGSGTGRIIADNNNYAIRIEWSNGVVFVRK